MLKTADSFAHRFAQLIVLCTFGLIYLGGLVTTHKAGMAVPDWPLSFNSLNPAGWWTLPGVNLEHSHRLFAATLGMLITILCARVWGNWWALLWAALASGAAVGVGQALHAPKLVLSHLGIWGFAFSFATFVLFSRGAWRKATGVQWLSFATFVGVAIQATLGGLRVTIESAGNPDLATNFRIVHGCVAQAQLCLLVALAVVLSPRWRAPIHAVARKGLRTLAWTTVAALYLQLIFGATIRHKDIGLAIPTFPQAQASGSWLPGPNPLLHLHFAHSRVGATLVSLLVISLAIRLLRAAQLRAAVSTKLGWLLLASVAIQVTLGVFVIWHTRPVSLTTFHVVNGAFLLATTLLIALRLQRTATVPVPASLSSNQPTPSLA